MSPHYAGMVLTTPTGEMDSKKADAVTESERRGEKCTRREFSSFSQRRTVSSGK